MSFTGGKLKLKGGEPLKGSVDKKRKKKKSTAVAVVDTDAPPPQQQVGETRVCWLDSIQDILLLPLFVTKPGLLCTCRMALKL